ncbi:MAG: hypothetical protein RL196_194 [Actinomycetota bacterium]
MYLKSLTLKGFKSFATPTTFAFEPGVTCVVGPNGSGKSNVVDALAWVMGEQGAKTLRGGKMEDVIFAGTTTKSPLGRAEVQLTIDNADGALPIDYSEVTISRTLFRNGGSEYAINGEACRLLDVQELLSDSGLGREMHVIVGQGQLDSVLRATPEERRGFIEEAAGILKHRRRKEKTERKLDAMQANLTRLNDLAGEVRRQLKPLGQQAEVAREAAGIAANLRDAKSRVLADDVVALQTELAGTGKNEHDLRSERNILQELLAENQVRLTELEATLVSSKVDEARNLAYRFDSMQEQLRSLLSMANQRVALLGSQGQVSAAQVDPAALEDQANESELLVREFEAAVEGLKASLAAGEATRAEARNALEAHDQELAEQTALISLFDTQLAGLQSACVAAESRATSMREELERSLTAEAGAVERYELRRQEFEALEAQVQAQSGPVNRAEGPEVRYEAATAAQSVITANIEELRDQLHQNERERDALSAKRSALNLMLDQKDGASLLAAAGLKGVRGLLANHVKTAKGYETAIAAALGALADAIVADSRESALDAIDYLKSNKGGRVSLVVADVEAKALQGRATPLKAGDSGAKRAAELVTAPTSVLALLENIVVVADLADARAFYGADAANSSFQLITLDGDLLAETVLRGGSNDQASKLELIAERDAAEVSLAELNATIESLNAQLMQARADEANAKDAVRTALAELKEHDAALAANAEKLGRARVAVEATTGERDRLAQVVARASESLAEAEAKLAEANKAFDSFSEAERPATTLGDRSVLAEALETARQSELELRIELGAASERLRVQQATTKELRTQVVAAREAIERARIAAAAQQQQLNSAQLVLAVLPTVMNGLAESASASKIALHDLETQRANQNAELVKLRGETAEIQIKLGTLTQQLHEVELSNHEKRLNLTGLLTRAHEELGLTPEILVAEYGPDVLIPGTASTGPDADPESPEAQPQAYSRQAQLKRLHDAERLLERLGKINPLALEEFAALEQRHQFLTEQLADLTQTRKDLMQIIEELDLKMQQIFADAFEDTRAAFEKVFPVLFPGGTGSIFLTNPDDMLTTGLEVNVRPAGKKIERLSLLSGGERSLAAVALLIAIFKARPSPFYVMDEVEAALDDSNLGRLLQIFQDLRTNSQLIIITHQKRTMEIADALYGVSMRQDGISAVVGQRIEELAR